MHLLTKDAAPGLSVKNSGLTLKAEAIGDDGTIEGYASVFGVVDSQNEVVETGAFSDSIAETRRTGRSVKMLWQHGVHGPIGVWNDLAEDSTGLHVRGRILKEASRLAAEAYALVKGEAVDELSIGYRTVRAAPHPEKRGVLSLMRLDLKEVSLVTFGSLGRLARVTAVKSILDGGELPSVREFEDHLRESGFSKSLATAIAAKAAPHLRGEPDGQVIDARAFLEALRS